MLIADVHDVVDDGSMKLLVAILLLVGTALDQKYQPPPPPPIVDCFVPGPWIVFFKADSAVLDIKSKSILALLVGKQRGICGNFIITIQGHVDGSERPKIARRRAEAVRTYLLEQGVSSGDMTMEDMGSRKPRVANRKGSTEPHNRRVEIHVR